mmetsp:Transcript_13747/g.35604  ORF Transcript_13747/g.35604 Transcript_13747/m.35604 type:complete len:85 (+) Transcript_13747:532-786(+)
MARGDLADTPSRSERSLLGLSAPERHAAPGVCGRASGAARESSPSGLRTHCAFARDPCHRSGADGEHMGPSRWWLKGELIEPSR